MTFPHSPFTPGDANLDGVTNAADLSIVLANMRKTHVQMPAPPMPAYPSRKRLYYVQISGPQRELADSPHGYNSPQPWLNAVQYGLERVWSEDFERNLSTGFYTGLCISGLTGCQDAYTQYHRTRNHGFLSQQALEASLGQPMAGRAMRWLLKLSQQVDVMLYCGGCPTPIDASGRLVKHEEFAVKGEAALSQASHMGTVCNASVGYDALSAEPMKSHPDIVLRTLTGNHRKPWTEGPAEHDDPRVLQNIMARCNEIGMVDNPTAPWSSTHVRMMLDPMRRAWKARYAPTCEEAWMVNGAPNEQARIWIETTAAAHNIMLIDQMRAV